MEIVLHLYAYCIGCWRLHCVALKHSLVGSGRAGGTHAEIMESHGTSGADINDQPPDVRTMFRIFIISGQKLSFYFTLLTSP